jgi:hypothetical protein
MAFTLMLLGATTFWWMLWKLINFVGDLIEFWISERNKERT